MARKRIRFFNGLIAVAGLALLAATAQAQSGTVGDRPANPANQKAATIIPMNQDPNQPGISDEIRMARQKKIIEARLKVRAAAMQARDSKTSPTTAATRKKARNPQGQSQDIVGKPAPGFKSITLDGKQIDLKDFRGKTVLVEFWAVWCGWCIAEVPAMKAIHDEFGKDPRFVMIGLSLDNDMDKLETYVKKNQMNWMQGFLGDWAKDKVTPIWGVNDIPDLFLIGPDGTIIARNAHGKMMRDEIAKALGKPAAKEK